MEQDEFALVVDGKTKPGLERGYERLMMEVVERQTADLYRDQRPPRF